MARKKKTKAVTRLEALVGELTFGSNLRSIRMAEELTQEQFAEKLDISAQHLCAIEKGNKSVSVERAALWAEYLGDSEKLFVQLALQDAVCRAGLEYEVTL